MDSALYTRLHQGVTTSLQYLQGSAGHVFRVVHIACICLLLMRCFRSVHTQLGMYPAGCEIGWHEPSIRSAARQQSIGQLLTNQLL